MDESRNRTAAVSDSARQTVRLRDQPHGDDSFCERAVDGRNYITTKPISVANEVSQLERHVVRSDRRKMKAICYIMIPIGMVILIVEGVLDFTKWLLVDISKSAVSFVIDCSEVFPCK